jgi:hypothetical protein
MAEPEPKRVLSTNLSADEDQQLRESTFSEVELFGRLSPQAKLDGALLAQRLRVRACLVGTWSCRKSAGIEMKKQGLAARRRRGA